MGLMFLTRAMLLRFLGLVHWIGGLGVGAFNHCLSRQMGTSRA